MFGANPGQAPEMNASLDLTVRRTLIDSRAAGYDMRTEIREPQSGYSLSFGLKEATIPEASASALYTFSQDGTVRMIEQLREKIYLPVSAFSTPLPTFPVTRETTWPKAMNVVVDLLNRDNTMAQASHAIDGLEWVNGRRTIRIRSEYKLDPRWTPYPLLALKPTRTPPEERVTRGELLKKATQPVAVGGYPGAAQPVGGATDAGNGLKFDDCVGIRYSWYDYQANALLRVDDFVLYSFPTTNLPSATGGDGTGQPGMGDPAMGNPGMGNPPPPGDTPPPLGAPGNNPFGGGGGVTKPTKPANAPKVGTAYYLVRLSYLTKTEE
jgi:hypothetical protein